MTSKVIQGHIRPLLCQNHSSTFVYGPILIKICMNANIKKTHFFLKYYDLKCHFYVMEKFCIFLTLRPFDLITSLTYVLMDNFCPCFSKTFVCLIPTAFLCLSIIFSPVLPLSLFLITLIK